MPGVLNEPRIVAGEKTESDEWSACDGVETHKMGTSSVIAVANEEGFLLSNASSDRSKDINAALELCTLYEENKSLFCNKPVTVWIVYHNENSSGPSIGGIMLGIQNAQIIEQMYCSESFMNWPTDEGALFRLELVDGTPMATMRRQDGHGSPVAVTGDGTILVPGPVRTLGSRPW
ncbi:unnamed protein product [Penicillium nalgiovense]|uniref:Uncharacterized protein n=1 Tax=Penicillium nalgiovense TaxID=60175 RepID=A0A1V6YK40_PENNA|nr:hypothetical protein PENNAL_c0019G09394 [Penicillium nalgiovense]CAG8039653.1 unnamed protein product [Penicillium nalgiovense]CAG8041340.1 unnamed protein product [Penicillium nalgiovense]CAG8069262.1 unnamed protein product [Penicillium nalgiovense]CAG8092375.1 unnamed protein product [Penicillium nalgiovense]